MQSTSLRSLSGDGAAAAGEYQGDGAAVFSGIYGCQAGLFRDALHQVYLPRIQRGHASFAANVLGVRGALLSALAAFFEHGHWGSLAETEVEGQSLSTEDQLFVLMQAGLYLTATRDCPLRCTYLL